MIRRWFPAANVGALVLLAACALPWVGLLTMRSIGDMPLFKDYGERMAHGDIPYRDFFFDWTPGSVPPVLFPALVHGNYDDWFHIFAAIYGALMVASVAATLALLRVPTRRLFAATIAAAALAGALGSITINSVDYWPALFTSAALAAVVAERPRLAGALLGIAIAIKIYPVVVLPVLLIWALRRFGRRLAWHTLAWCLGAGLLVALPFAALGPGGLRYSLWLQLKRGLQMESLGASVLMALDHLGLLHVDVVVGQPYSLDIPGVAAHLVALFLTLVLVGALVYVYGVFAAGPVDAQRILVAATAAVAAYIAFGRVLSPQYLIWLFPLVPLVAGRVGIAATALLFAACAVTNTWFPDRFFHLADVSSVSWFVLLRNLLLVALFVLVVRDLRATAPRRVRAALRDVAKAV